MDKITVFYGSNKGYREFLRDRNILLDEATLFPEIISQYNETIRASNKGYMDQTNKFYTDDKGYAEHVVIMQNDFSSVLEHVISNFAHIISLAHIIENLLLQNPPKRVMDSLLSSYSEDIFEYKYSEYTEFSINAIKDMREEMESSIIGQDKAKFSVLSSLYQLSKKKDNKPIVLHFYGPSGVGKTELAKSISEYFEGDLLRIQFSMMQTEEAYKYIFGDTHSKASFAGDLLSRESNVVLIDEFDKVQPIFYNAFYEVFDEGIFRDLNYSVDVKNTIFILTSNFKDLDEMNKNLGLAMSSRIAKSIQFYELDISSVKKILDKRYQEVIELLNDDEKQTIEKVKLLDWYHNQINNFKNMRSLKASIEQDIYDVLTNDFLTIL